MLEESQGQIKKSPLHRHSHLLSIRQLSPLALLTIAKHFQSTLGYALSTEHVGMRTGLDDGDDKRLWI